MKFPNSHEPVGERRITTCCNGPVATLLAAEHAIRYTDVFFAAERALKMAHPLVDQFRFTRHEFKRGLEGVSPDDATHHFAPMNCISWTVGHLAYHEQLYWMQFPQGQIPFPKLNELYAYGAPMSTPVFAEMLAVWEEVTHSVDSFLGTLTTDVLQTELLRDGKAVGQTIGSALHRITYHYWYHIGEIQAIRQMLGHLDLPEYVGDVEIQAPYRPE